MLRSITFLAALLATACAGRPGLPESPPAGTLRVQLRERGVEVIRDVPLEDYVAAAALGEFAPAAGDAAAVATMFEVQTVIARTFALAHRGRHAQQGFDLCSTTHCQIYEPGRLATSRWTPVVQAALARTRSLILSYAGGPADAPFHSDCGGWTSSAADAWGGVGLPYLRTARDDGAAAAAHAGWQFPVDAGALQRALDADPRTRVSGRLSSIAVLSRDNSGRAQRVLLHGASDVAVRGADLREVMTATFGVRSIKSTLFDVVARGRQFVFSGSGFGHGVGLCQVGAFARVAAGGSAGEVLAYYYPGTTLVDIRKLRLSSRRPRD